MLGVTTVLVLLCLGVQSQAADDQRFARGAHLLHATIDDNDTRCTFNLDVKIQTKHKSLTLTVLSASEKKLRTPGESKMPEEGDAAERPDAGSAKSPDRSPGQSLSPYSKQKLRGAVGAEGSICFGVTTMHDGKLVSLHFVGRTELGGASGAVYLLSTDQPVREGKWRLLNPSSRPGSAPGYNGPSPFGK